MSSPTTNRRDTSTTPNSKSSATGVDGPNAAETRVRLAAEYTVHAYRAAAQKVAQAAAAGRGGGDAFPDGAAFPVVGGPACLVAWC